MWPNYLSRLSFGYKMMQLKIRKRGQENSLKDNILDVGHDSFRFPQSHYFVLAL